MGRKVLEDRSASGVSSLPSECMVGWHMKATQGRGETTGALLATSLREPLLLFVLDSSSSLNSSCLISGSCPPSSYAVVQCCMPCWLPFESCWLTWIPYPLQLCFYGCWGPSGTARSKLQKLHYRISLTNHMQDGVIKKFGMAMVENKQVQILSECEPTQWHWPHPTRT